MLVLSPVNSKPLSWKINKTDKKEKQIKEEGGYNESGGGWGIVVVVECHGESYLRFVVIEQKNNFEKEKCC